MGVDYTPDGDVPEESGPTSDEILAEAARRLLDSQISANDVLDARIVTAFGVGSTVLPVTIGLLNLLQTTISVATEVLLIGALVAYGAQIVCASTAFLRHRRLDFRPNVETLQAYTFEYDGQQLRRWVADEHVRSISHNQEVLRWKGSLTLGVIASLYVEAALLSIAAFLTVV
jgi:hypothetical protein